MSQLLAAQNHLKAQAGPNRLTDQQRRAYEIVADHWRFPARLHLCGPAGSGKTYLAWVIARSRATRFLAGPEQLADDLSNLDGQALIIDNINPDAYVLRHLLASLDLYRVRQALLISRMPNANLLPMVALGAPTAEDAEHVRRNLQDAGYFSHKRAQSANLWAVVHSSLS